jgi:hypothetical protein
VIDLLKTKPGLRTEEIASELDVASAIIKMIMRSLVDEDLVETSGQRRGTKYTLATKRAAAAAGEGERAKVKTGARKRATSKKTTASRKTTTRRRSSSKRASTGRRSTWRSVSRARRLPPVGPAELRAAC